MVTVLSVRQCENSLSFLELSRFAGLSHIRCLRKDLIGCGVQGEINAPCVANWRTGEVVTFSAPEVDVSHFVTNTTVIRELKETNRVAALL